MNSLMANSVERPIADDWAEVRFRCPRCACAMDASIYAADLASKQRECHKCGSTMYASDGIWKAILPARTKKIEASLTAYETVREKEGRWSEDDEFYRALPWRDTTGRFESQWKIRAASFDFVLEHALPACAMRVGRQSLRVLDLGAGNCWMSYRLALHGHLPVAVDIGVGRKDGLGAARHYAGTLGRLFPRVQAEMDWLPFADAQFDVAIYNASFHYAQDYDAAIREALRVLRRDGSILIVDSPTYPREADGEAMRREKTAEFKSKFGTASGSMGGQGYLTHERLARLEQFGICWERFSPWRGWRWVLRPVIARLFGRRTPSRFYVYQGTLKYRATEAD